MPRAIHFHAEKHFRRGEAYQLFEIYRICTKCPMFTTSGGFPPEPSMSLKRSKKGGIPPQPRTGLGEQFFSVFTGRKTGGAIFRTNGSNSIGKRRVFASTIFRGDGVPKRGRAVAASGEHLPTHGVRSEGAAAEPSFFSTVYHERCHCSFQKYQITNNTDVHSQSTISIHASNTPNKTCD